MTRTSPHTYSSLQAFIYDRLIAGHMVHLHGYILEQGGLEKVLTAPKAQEVLDVGLGVRQFAIQLKACCKQLHN